MSTQTMQLSEALVLADRRNSERKRQIASELAEMRSQGALVHVTASELALLEQNDFVYHFDTGQVSEAVP